jgi:Tol biopolymer transport system component
MSIATGTRLGCYEVVAQIGAGGMGEVYQAHDTKLGRDVAIKVLPANFVNDPERLSRFQREARMLAQLNHTNIATIYGLEQSGGTSYLVMELVSGATLAERVKAGPLPIEEALKIAIQIAEALEAAHEKSIIHRDLKPANVKVTPEGKVKVLDFGLAKAFEGDAASEDMSNSPTLSRAATMQGVILGTAAYMSPEQARGRAVDKRTDIWAFGCVLYELLSGKQAFDGEDITEILAAVVKTEPDWQVLPPTTPGPIRILLKRCLQKDKTLRLQAAGDARIEIQEALTAPASVATVSVAANRLAGWRLAVFIALSALVAATVAGFAVWNLRPAPQLPVTRTVINLPPGDQLAALDFPAIAISPDGARIAYVAFHSGTRQIYLRALDSLEAKPLAGTEGANTPFFSPDGQWLGFFASGKLKKILVNGGVAVPLSNGAAPTGAMWGNNGTIVFAPINTGVLEQIPDAGGIPKALTRFDKGEFTHGWPDLLPGSKTVLFVAGAGGSNLRIVAQSLGTGDRREIVQGGTVPHYAATGHLVYAQGGTLMAAPFDPQQQQLRGGSVSVVEGVLQSGFIGAAQYTLSETGSLAYVPGGNLAGDRLVWVSRNGKEQALGAPPHNYLWPRISPDGRQIAVGIGEGETQVWLYDLAREALTRFAPGVNGMTVPVWTPDGKRLAFTSNKDGPQNIYWQMADGSSETERLTSSEYPNFPMSFSRDGQLLSYGEINPTTGYEIWVLKMADRKMQPFLRSPFNEGVPRLSPDGHWLSYVSDESGRWEVCLQPYPGPGGKYQISTEGGTEPVWNPKGNELFYRSGNKMMAVDITPLPNFSIGKPRMLFQGPYLPTLGTLPYYDVSPDGQRFLMIKLNEESSSSSSLKQIVVVQNWFDELKRRVPAGM